ncbi:glycosyltransferase family 2 protein [Thiorhodococcus minor]|uniref:Glycosyltransferase family 2 protein n=1 Tax=Thiorhodococcus minor TaxID=57489 RepID=A0A6M0K1K9_9GAMM|nr:glycosyltransferase family 2 protein [Thiorhodococcus minor]NEV62205.1 glycosyltransferase family 2 protein [Thiorhodococcus minor]
MQPLISVVIPLFNGMRFIGATLSSVTHQTYQSLEILVVDDGSTDASVDVVRARQRQDPRIRLLRQPNRGVAAARNLAIDAARGDYIAPLDADDLWHPRKLERQLRQLRDAPDVVGVVYSPQVSIDEQDRILATCALRRPAEGVVWLQLLLGNLLGSASTPLIKRTCLERSGLYDERFFAARAQGCEDWDLYFRLAEHCEFRFQPECLVAYRQLAHSMSLDTRAMLRSYALMLEHLQSRGRAIPRQLMRWSRARYLLYLLERCTRQRLCPAWPRLVLSVSRSDPACLLDRRFWRSLGRIGLAGVGLRRPRAGGALPRLSDCGGDWGAATTVQVGSQVPDGSALATQIEIRRRRRIDAWQRCFDLPVTST